VGYLPLTVHVYSFNLHSQLRKKVVEDELVRYGRSRSFKVIKIGINRMRLPITLPLHQLHVYLLSFLRFNDLLVENLRFPPFYPPQSHCDLEYEK